MGAQVYCGRAVMRDGTRAEIYRATAGEELDEYYVREAVGEDGAGPVHGLHRRRPIGRFATFREAVAALERGMA